MKKKIVILISLLLILTVFFILGYPSVYQIQCQSRVFQDMQNKLSESMTSNVNVIKVTEHDGMKGYSVGASGVIICKEEQTYYALTAYHVIKEENTFYLVSTINDETINEYRENHPEVGHVDLSGYYSQFAKAKIIYTCEASDLAIIRFKSKQDLAVAYISGTVPVKGDRIVAVGTDAVNNIHFVTTYGKVKSGRLSTFQTEDGQIENNVLKHNAYIVEGFSGGAVFNENMELVGITIGGGTDIFGRFRYGAMIPCDQIQQCISESEVKIKSVVNSLQILEEEHACL